MERWWCFRLCLNGRHIVWQSKEQKDAQKQDKPRNCLHRHNCIWVKITKLLSHNGRFHKSVDHRGAGGGLWNRGVPERRMDFVMRIRVITIISLFNWKPANLNESSKWKTWKPHELFIQESLLIERQSSLCLSFGGDTNIIGEPKSYRGETLRVSGLNRT